MACRANYFMHPSLQQHGGYALHAVCERSKRRCRIAIRVISYATIDELMADAAIELMIIIHPTIRISTMPGKRCWPANTSWWKNRSAIPWRMR